MMAISGVVGAIYKASGTSTAFTDEATTNTGDNMRYKITDHNKAYWDNTAPVVVEVGGSAVTSGFTIEHAGGHVVFDDDQGSAVVTVSGKYFTAVPIGGGFNWTLDIEVDTLEVTTFLSAGWKQFLAAQKGFSGSFEKYWADGETWSSEIGNTSLILVLYTDSTTSKSRYEGYATITSNSVETPADDLITESCDFSGSGKLYYREG